MYFTIFCIYLRSLCSQNDDLINAFDDAGIYHSVKHDFSFKSNDNSQLILLLFNIRFSLHVKNSELILADVLVSLTKECSKQ